jgi:hypothetical protein
MWFFSSTKRSANSPASSPFLLKVFISYSIWDSRSISSDLTPSNNILASSRVFSYSSKFFFVISIYLSFALHFCVNKSISCYWVFIFFSNREIC